MKTVFGTDIMLALYLGEFRRESEKCHKKMKDGGSKKYQKFK